MCMRNKRTQIAEPPEKRACGNVASARDLSCFLPEVLELLPA